MWKGAGSEGGFCAGGGGGGLIESSLHWLRCLTIWPRFSLGGFRCGLAGPHMSQEAGREGLKTPAIPILLCSLLLFEM